MEDFGKILHNVSRASVNNWEKGKSVPKKDKLEKMSLISGYTVAEILTIVTSLLGKTKFDKEDEIFDYMPISKEKELYLALANHGAESKAFMYLDREKEVVHLAPFIFTDMSLLHYLDFLKTSNLSHYVLTHLKKFNLGDYPKIVLYSLKVIDTFNGQSVTRDQVYYLKYNAKLNAYEFEMEKEKK